MKLIAAFLIVGLLNVSAAVKAQNEILEFKTGNFTVKEVFNEITKQLKFDVFYSDDELDTKQKVYVSNNQMRLDDVLELVLHNNFKYELLDKMIIIQPNKPQDVKVKKITISGTISDKQKLPLPGVTVLIKGTTLGVTTDIDGKYSIDVPDSEDLVLVYSFIGMETQEITYKGNSEINVVMLDDVEEMEEVVITGMFNRKKEGFTGSANKVTGDEIRQMTSGNVLRAIDMIEPGFRMNMSNIAGSNPNAMPDFEMRGQANMGNYDGEDVVVMRGDMDTRPNQPLFVLDGIIGVNISTIIDMDPNQIESITVLKDAAAMVIYGSRASNGVIVIETKAPERGRLRVTYNGNYKFQAPDLGVYNLLNAADKLELERIAGYYMENYTSESVQAKLNVYLAKYLDVQRGVNTYWLSKPVRNSFSHRHGVNIEGGDNTIRFKLYVGANFSPGIMKGTGIDGKSASFDFRYRNENLLISNQIAVEYTIGDRTSPYGSFKEYTLLNPYYRVYDENGAIRRVLDNNVYTYNGITTSLGNYGTPTLNPMYNTLYHQKDQSTNFQLRNSFKVEYNPFPNLRLASDVVITYMTDEVDIFKPSSHTDFDGKSVEERGSYDWTRMKNFSYNVSFTGSYNKYFDKHLISAFARYDIDERTNHQNRIKAKGFPNDNMDELFLGNEMDKINGEEGKTRSIGFVSTVNYSYDQKYAIDGSFRLDASSEFGKNNRVAPFWSTGVRWNMDKENFIQSLGVMDELVLRATYGVTGSQGFSPYQALQMYTYDGMMRDYHSSDVSGTVLYGIGNPNLKWQKTNNLNLGLDFTAFSNIISGRFEYYTKYTKNTLLDYSLAPSVGFETIVDNMGDISNKGYEFNLRIMPYNNLAKQLNVSVVVNGSHNKNEIKKISNALKVRNQEAAEKVESRPLPRYEEGYSMSRIWAVQSKGIDPSTGKELFIKRNGETTYDWDVLDQVAVGDTEPTLRGNVGLNLNWKGLSLNVACGYKFGGQMYNYTLIEKVENADLLLNVDKRAFTERWQKPGDIVKYKGITRAANGSETKASSRFVMDDNEFTISSINLQYRFEQSKFAFLKKAGISMASVALYLEDIARFSTVKMERGIDYPFSRQVSMSLNVIF